MVARFGDRRYTLKTLVRPTAVVLSAMQDDAPVGVVGQGNSRPTCPETVGVSVTPIVVRRVRLSGRSLLQAAQNGGAGLRHAGIDRLAPWHDRPPAAFFDICRLFPMSWSFAAPSGCWRRRRYVGTDRHRSPLSPRPRRYWRCCPPNVFAVLPSIHPPQPKPTSRVATAPTVAPCRSRFRDSPWYQADV